MTAACDPEAAWKGASSGCPAWPDDSASFASALLEALAHPGVGTWTQRVALLLWLAVAAAVVVPVVQRRRAGSPDGASTTSDANDEEGVPA